MPSNRFFLFVRKLFVIKALIRGNLWVSTNPMIYLIVNYHIFLIFLNIYIGNIINVRVLFCAWILKIWTIWLLCKLSVWIYWLMVRIVCVLVSLVIVVNETLRLVQRDILRSEALLILRLIHVRLVNASEITIHRSSLIFRKIDSIHYCRLSGSRLSTKNCSIYRSVRKIAQTWLHFN